MAEGDTKNAADNQVRAAPSIVPLPPNTAPQGGASAVQPEDNSVPRLHPPLFSTVSLVSPSSIPETGEVPATSEAPVTSSPRKQRPTSSVSNKQRESPSSRMSQRGAAPSRASQNDALSSVSHYEAAPSRASINDAASSRMSHYENAPSRASKRESTQSVQSRRESGRKNDSQHRSEFGMPRGPPPNEPPLSPPVVNNGQREAPGAVVPPSAAPPVAASQRAPPQGSSQGTGKLPHMPFYWMEMNNVKEEDDDLHDPTKNMPVRGAPQRAILNLGALTLLILAMLMLFAGYPILHHFTQKHENEDRSATIAEHLKFNNPPNVASGVPINRANHSNLPNGYDQDLKMLIDPDTPRENYTLASTYTKAVDADGNPKKFQLVFSDEFNTDGRSFYPGEDPFWEAVDLHYWATNNYEWYDPAAVFTKDGALHIRLEQHVEHNLNFRGGMLQSWNKFCFTGGILIASVQMPGYAKVPGLWPAFWLMGNLGRAGYGSTLQGTWPYSYDQCDVGTTMNQTIYNSTYPNGYPADTLNGGATMFNQKHNTRALSFLPGQKLSACTCKGEDHPGPWLKDENRYRGRAAPEIDVFEAQPDSNDGMKVSQSCQIAPYNWLYQIDYPNNTKFYDFYDNYRRGGGINIYTGEITQQSLSGVNLGSQTAVQHNADSNVPTGKWDDPNFAICTLLY